MSLQIVEPCSVRIKKALSLRRMTQTELCTMTKISKSSLSEYTNGKHIPNQEKVFILAKALNVDPVWLWGYDVPMEKKDDQPETKKFSPDKMELTERDLEILQVFRLIPEDQQRMFLEMGRAYANSLKKD